MIPNAADSSSSDLDLDLDPKSSGPMTKPITQRIGSGAAWPMFVDQQIISEDESGPNTMRSGSWINAAPSANEEEEEQEEEPRIPETIREPSLAEAADAPFTRRRIPPTLIDFPAVENAPLTKRTVSPTVVDRTVMLAARPLKK